MGEFFVSGEKALELIQKVTVNDASKLFPGKAQYSCMCYADGGIVDDLIVYMLAENEYMLVVNGANVDKDFAWIQSQNTMGAELVNRSDDYALLAVQGPKAAEALQKLTDVNLEEIGFYSFKTGELAGIPMIISATGYTGEPGFELYFEHANVDVAQFGTLFLKRVKNLASSRADLELAIPFALKWDMHCMATTSPKAHTH